MSHGGRDYHWWDLDGTELAGVLHSVLMPIQLGADDYGNDWDEFQRLNPAGAYAWQVGSQHEVLDQAIIALRPVQKFVRVRRLPIATSRGNITREEWLRATIDLFLFRMSGIRDHCLHLVSVVFELGFAPLDVKSNKILNAVGIKGTELGKLIQRVASIGSSLRGERNKRAHEGIQRVLTKDPFFTYLSLFEQVSSKRKMKPKVRRQIPKDGSIPFQNVTNSDDYDLPSVYLALASKLENEFLPLGDQMVQAVKDLTGGLCNPFCDRLDAKPSPVA
jgi:hypothetical protein